MTSRAYFHDDTLRVMANWAAKRYRLGSVHIFWRSYIPDPNRGLRCCTSGATYYAKDGTSPFFIELLQTRSCTFLTEVLAHELAHCIAAKRHQSDGHGPKFEAIHRKLLSDWNASVRKG